MKWAKQGFLNSPYSSNNGRFKFSIQPGPKGVGRNLTHSIEYMIADCANEINLEFSPPYITSDATVEQLTKALSKIRRRRNKMEKFDKVIRQANDKILEVLLADESLIMHMLEKKRKESRRPAKMKAGS